MSVPHFPPSFHSFPDFEAESSSSALDPGPNKKHKKEKREPKHQESRKEERRKRKRKEHHERSLSPTAQSYGSSSKEYKDDDSLRYFYIDTRGDAKNVQFGRPHKGDVPKYHVVNHGRKILGLSSQWTATRSDIGIEVGRAQGRSPALTDPKTKRLLAAPPTRLSPHSAQNEKYQELDGVFRLPSHQKSSMERAIDEEEEDDDEKSSEDDSSGDEDADGRGRSLTAHQETLKSLEQGIADNPSSVSNWLALLSRTISTIDPSSKNAAKARADISISVIERAFSAHPRNKSSKRLRLKYVRAGSEIWPEERIQEEWEYASQLGDADIWMEWFEARIGSGMEVSDIFELANHILSRLDENSEDDDYGKVRVLWRVAVACQEAGHPERATALFQAEAELLFEVPQALHGLPIERVLDALEEFWESEVPRFGEPGSKGWASWLSHNSQLTPVTPSTRVEREDLDPYRQWAINESIDDEKMRWPLRSSDESSDPYSTILFSDLRQALFTLQSERAKKAFRYAWLSVLGLPIPGLHDHLAIDEGSLDDRWCLHYLTKPNYLDAIFPSSNRYHSTSDSVLGVTIGRQKEYLNSFGPVKNWSMGSFDPLSSVFGKHPMWNQVDVAGLDEGSVRRIIRQLRLGSEDIEWDTLALAFEAATDVKSALKHSRTLLETSRDSLPHWAIHAKLERMRGRINEARKVYQTVLIASSSPTRRPGECNLWWDWAEMEWQSKHPEEALNVVLKVAGIEGRGGVAILRAKGALSDEAKGCSNWKEAESLTLLGALLELLTSENVAMCQRIFDNRLDSLREGDVVHESMTIQSLLFLFTFSIRLKNPMPPEVLRVRAERSLRMYPSNSVILGVLLECEKGQGVWGRVRGLLGNSGDVVKDVSRRIQEIWIAQWDSQRWESELERTRMSLEIAVGHERTRKSSVLWRLFIELEIRTKRLADAKKLLFRGIGECRLSKELYLLAFVPLRSEFSSKELNGLAELMAERGIRMRQSIEEVVIDWKGADKRGREDSGEEDEIEVNSRELERLKPY